MSADAPKFTLRFHNKRTHELLGLVAERLGVSKNRLAEEMLERELHAAALLVGQDPGDTLRKLRRHDREERLDEDIADFAEGEASGQDPLRSRMIGPEELGDDFGVMRSFRG